jgi:hypothetical protein
MAVAYQLKPRQQVIGHVPAPIHEGTDKYHCPTCYAQGNETARYFVVIRWDGSDIEWLHTFPCQLSQREFLETNHDLIEIVEQGGIE